MAKVTIEIDDKILEAFNDLFVVNEKYQDDFCIDVIGKENIIRKVIEKSISERWLDNYGGSRLKRIVSDDYIHYNESGVMYDLLYEASLELDK